jgi:hypothetical protein
MADTWKLVALRPETPIADAAVTSRPRDGGTAIDG